MELLNQAALIELVGEELTPDNWDSLSQEERLTLLTETAPEGESSGEGEGSENELIAHAERIPRTIAFTVLALGQLFHVIAIHAGDQRSLFRVWFSGNQFLLLAVILTILLQLSVIYVPFLQATFETYPVNVSELLICFGIAALLTVFIEIEKLILPTRAESST
jgi:magnesium-transporting ATPase (P-type)